MSVYPTKFVLSCGLLLATSFSAVAAPQVIADLPSSYPVDRDEVFVLRVNPDSTDTLMIRAGSTQVDGQLSDCEVKIGPSTYELRYTAMRKSGFLKFSGTYQYLWPTNPAVQGPDVTPQSLARTGTMDTLLAVKQWQDEDAAALEQDPEAQVQEVYSDYVQLVCQTSKSDGRPRRFGVSVEFVEPEWWF